MSRMTPAQKKLYFNTWEENHEKGVYLLRSYKLQYITITRWMPGEIDPLTKETYVKVQYIPTYNGTRLKDVWKFDTLDEAKKGVMEQIDRDIELGKSVKYVRVRHSENTLG